MQHVVTRPDPPFEAMGGALRVHMVPAAQDNLSWLAECTQTGEVAVVDGPSSEPVLAYAQVHGLHLRAVFNTHTHGDHIGVNHGLARSGKLGTLRVVGAAAVAAEVPGLTEPVGEGDEVRLGAVTGEAMLTEGHIDGHISLVFGDVLFCGDTLFTAGCGRVFSGPPSKMFDSLLRLAALDGETRVCCAHEYTQDNLRFAWSVEPDNEALADRIRRVWAVRSEGRSAVPSTIEEER
ncbi:MAG: hydroxyacylglutathione hydrolase, partial [Deltaproteobacteria bacterium]|nr:hydroxyacylglutathione hydrolase [Deltaproteobacteria bacterium]